MNKITNDFNSHIGEFKNPIVKEDSGPYGHFIKWLLVFLAIGVLIGWSCTRSWSQETPTPTRTATATPTATVTQTPTFWPTPMVASDGSANGEYVGGGKVQFYGAPIYHHDMDDGGKLKRNDDSAVSESTNLVGKKLYKFDKRSMKSGLIADTTEGFFAIQDDRDWQYPDRKTSFTILSTKWTGKNVKLDITPDYQKAGVIYAASEIAIRNGNNSAQIFTLRDKGKTVFQITYRIDCSDLVSDCKQGDLGEYTFTTPGGQLRFRIYPPKVADAVFSIIDGGGTFAHSLVKVTDGEYLYVKSGTITSVEAIWVDADIFYPSGGGNGVILSYGTTEFSDILAGSGTASLSVNSTNANYLVLQQDAYRQLVDSYSGIDTSSIPVGSVITDGKLYMYVSDVVNDYSALYVHVDVGTQTSGTLTTSDWNHFSASIGNTATISGAGWLAAMDVTSRIVAGGRTKFHFREGQASAGSSVDSGQNSIIIPTHYIEVTYQTPTVTPTATSTPTATPIQFNPAVFMLLNGE